MITFCSEREFAPTVETHIVFFRDRFNLARRAEVTADGIHIVVKIICSADECVGLLCFFLVAHAHCNFRIRRVTDRRAVCKRLITDFSRRYGKFGIIDLRHVIERNVYLAVARGYAHGMQLVGGKIVYKRSASDFRRRSVFRFVEFNRFCGKIYRNVHIVVGIGIAEHISCCICARYVIFCGKVRRRGSFA